MVVTKVVFNMVSGVGPSPRPAFERDYGRAGGCQVSGRYKTIVSVRWLTLHLFNWFDWFNLFNWFDLHQPIQPMKQIKLI